MDDFAGIRTEKDTDPRAVIEVLRSIETYLDRRFSVYLVGILLTLMAIFFVEATVGLGHSYMARPLMMILPLYFLAPAMMYLYQLSRLRSRLMFKMTNASVSVGETLQFSREMISRANRYSNFVLIFLFADWFVVLGVMLYLQTSLGF